VEIVDKSEKLEKIINKFSSLKKKKKKKQEDK
jgi:PII-like signaling protein